MESIGPAISSFLQMKPTQDDIRKVIKLLEGYPNAAPTDLSSVKDQERHGTSQLSSKLNSTAWIQTREKNPDNPQPLQRNKDDLVQDEPKPIGMDSKTESHQSKPQDSTIRPDFPTLPEPKRATSEKSTEAKSSNQDG